MNLVQRTFAGSGGIAHVVHPLKSMRHSYHSDSYESSVSRKGRAIREFFRMGLAEDATFGSTVPRPATVEIVYWKGDVRLYGCLSNTML